MPMTRWFWLVFLITGCAPAARTTGSFVARPAAEAMRAIAVDAARQLSQLFPPAHTQLAFVHTTSDDLGRPLVTALRGLGFAVAERSARGSHLALAYVVDEIEPFYRVVIRIRTARRRITLARAYAHRGFELRAAGAWTELVQP